MINFELKPKSPYYWSSLCLQGGPSVSVIKDCGSPFTILTLSSFCTLTGKTPAAFMNEICRYTGTANFGGVGGSVFRAAPVSLNGIYLDEAYLAQFGTFVIVEYLIQLARDRSKVELTSDGFVWVDDSALLEEESHEVNLIGTQFTRYLKGGIVANKMYSYNDPTKRITEQQYKAFLRQCKKHGVRVKDSVESVSCF